MVTVYRTLGLLSGLGLVRRLDLGAGPRYELAEDHHHHLICERCGEITEFETCPLDLRWLPGARGDFQVRAHSLEVYGTCSDCR
jgi:Fe2+ or Zn2+ uptake regulation protein